MENTKLLKLKVVRMLEKIFGKYPELTELVSSLTDKDIWRLNKGIDPTKFIAYSADEILDHLQLS